jgi:hypothetical protein
MSWIRLDDRVPDHRKMLAAGAEACWLRTDRDEPIHKLENRIRNAKGRTE